MIDLQICGMINRKIRTARERGADDATLFRLYLVRATWIERVRNLHFWEVMFF